MILFLNSVQAQTTVIAKGIITQQNGDPIIGVSVVVKSTGKELLHRQMDRFR
jgi:hypothetical protein